MSIKKGKKQVYKVECKHKFGNMVGNTWNNVLYGNCYLCNKTVKVSPLKPKKSIKKKETKVQELERRIKALEAHRCNPMPQMPNVPYVPQQWTQSYCKWCGNPQPCGQSHYIC